MSKNRLIHFLKNPIAIIILSFLIWMMFFDTHNMMLHHELNKEIESKKKEEYFYRNEIRKDQKEIKALETEEGTEGYAREKYFMKKDNEDIFIIEYADSLKNKSKK